MSHRHLTIHLPVAAATLAALAITAAPALAHTSANPSTTAAGSFAVVDMRVPHGCDGAPTVTLDVAIPAGVVSVKPEQVPGWDVTTETGAYDEPVELHGQELTEGVVSVTWTAQDPTGLPDGQFRDFGLSVRLPDTAGATLYFPAVQTCDDGSEAAWIEIPTSEDEELDKPAPAITLTEARHGDHGTGDDAADPASVELTDTDPDELAVLGATDENGRDPLVLLALGVGILGLLAGGAGFAAARRH